MDHGGVKLGDFDESTSSEQRDELIIDNVDYVRSQLKHGQMLADFAGLVDPDSYALVGHSRGGGAATRAGSRGGEVKLTASLFMAASVPDCEGFAVPVSEVCYESFLGIGGTNDSRYAPAQMMHMVDKKVRSTGEGFRAAVILEGADHSVPVAVDLHGFMQNGLVKLFSIFLRGDTKEIHDVCNQKDSKYMEAGIGSKITKGLVTAALMRAFHKETYAARAFMHSLPKALPEYIADAFEAPQDFHILSDLSLSTRSKSEEMKQIRIDVPVKEVDALPCLLRHAEAPTGVSPGISEEWCAHKISKTKQDKTAWPQCLIPQRLPPSS
jgi:pimeloyl-ACP methyl ester carboxylesterase